MLNNILIPFDGSGHSYNAAKFAAEISKLVQGAKCTVITVLTFTKEEARFLGASDQDFEVAKKTFSEKHFKDITAIFQDIGTPLTSLIIEGDPAKEILKYAEQNNIDHIVIGPRGLGNIQGVFLGSVSSKIIHSTKCPVTLVKEQN